MKRSVYTKLTCIIIIHSTVVSHPPDLPISISMHTYVQELERRAREHLRLAQEQKDIYQVFATLTIQGQLQTCIDLRMVENTEQLKSTIIHLRTESEQVADEIMQTIGEVTHQAAINRVQEIMREIRSRNSS